MSWLFKKDEEPAQPRRALSGEHPTVGDEPTTTQIQLGPVATGGSSGTEEQWPAAVNPPPAMNSAVERVAEGSGEAAEPPGIPEPPAPPVGLLTGEPTPAEPPVLVDPVVSPPDPAPVDDVSPMLPSLPSELASFGEQGILRPVPTGLAKQPSDLLTHVPDTAIEWADHEGFSLRGVSVRGHVHRYEHSVRQDQLAVGQVGGAWVAAVSDGLGSQGHSHLGAALASRYVVGWKALEQLIGSGQQDFSCAEVASILGFEAARRGLEPQTVSTTLTFAVVGSRPQVDETGSPRWSVAVAQVGDSHAYLLREGRWSKVTDSGADGDTDIAMSNVVEPLPRYTRAQVWHLAALPGDVLALTSDGAGNLLEDEPEFAAALAAQWAASAPSPAALLYLLDAAVMTYDDDRTFLGIRFGGA